jgi:uncharacterized protein
MTIAFPRRRRRPRAVLPPLLFLFAAVVAVAGLLSIVPAPARAEFVLPPPPGRHVIDKAGIIDAGTMSYLEERLTRFERATGHQMVIAIFRSVEGDDVEDVSNRLFRHWGLGSRTANDGILLAIFFQERTSRIEVGYGLEGVLTDARCARIIRNEFQPEFQTGRYGQGLRRVVAAVEQIVRDPSSAPADPAPGGDGEGKSSSSFWIAILAAFILFSVISMASARARRDGSELTGRGRRGYRDPWDGWGGGGGFGGFGGFGGGGGGWGGGSFGGGGGGFSGGGGSSGGGGASGKW